MKWFLALMLLPVLLGLGAILGNQVPLFNEPGVLKRLSVYLTQNRVAVEDKALFPELHPRSYYSSAEDLIARVESHMLERGWALADEPQESDQPHSRPHYRHFVVTTDLFNFKDDVQVWAEDTEHGNATLWVVSSSRVGKADFGANLAHVLTIYAALATR